MSDRQIATRLPAAEYAVLDQERKRDGLSMAAHVRLLLMRHAHEAGRSMAEQAIADRETRRLLEGET